MATPSSTLQVNINGRDNLSPVLSQMESKLIRFVGAVSSAMAAIKVASFPVVAAAEFEREMANVKKTTEFSVTEIQRLGAELEKLSLRVNVSAVDLAKVAAAAGQQGLGRLGAEGIAMFTESVSRMASVLDVSAEQAANDVGKIMNIFGTQVTEIENVVSAFNESSNNSTASGEELLNVVRRIGDAAGTINLQESLGLAASGIDFGMSPEVVGTSYGKIFADMRAKAEEFAKLMKMSTKEWLATIDGPDGKNGIVAYKKYLARLRQLDSASQARAISELSGRGRIFSLINKNVQDETDSVLNKNLGYAQSGFDSGESALKEQKTVLETLKSQYEILKNSIFSLSTEAGNQTLTPLTGMLARLSAALQQPAVKSFVEAMGSSIVEMARAIESTAKFLAGLNINWENFIRIAQVMLGLKILDMLAGWASRIKLVSGGTLQLIAAIRGTTTAQQQLNAAQGAAAGNSASTLANIINQWRARRKAVQETAAAEAAAAAAARNNTIVEGRAVVAAADMRQADRNLNTANANQQQAKKDVTKVMRENAANVAALERRKEQAEAAAIARRNANIAAIEQEFAGRRSAEDRANKQALIAAETAHFNRQLGGLNSAAARRATAEAAQGAARLAAARAHEAQMTAIVVQAEAARLAAQGRLRAAQDLMNRSDADLRRANAEMERTRAVARNASGAVMTFGTAFAGLGAILRGALGLLSKAFFWISMIYMVADAFGLVDKFGQYIQKFTDFLGLTSESARASAQAAKERDEAIQKEKKLVEDLIEKYDQLKDSATGEINSKKLQEIEDGIKNGGSEQQATSASKLGDALRAGEVELNNGKFSPEQYDKSVEEARKKVNNLATAWETVRDKAKLAHDNNHANWRILAAQEKDAKEKLDAARKALGALTATSRTSLQLLAKNAEATYLEVAGVLNGLFTAESEKLFNTFIVPITKLQEDLKNKRNERMDSEQKENEFKDDPAKLEAQKNKTKELIDQQRVLQAKLIEMQTAFKKQSDAILNDKAVSEWVKNSVAFLNTLAGISSAQALAYQNALKVNQTDLTGASAPQRPSGKTTGEDAYDPKAPKSNPEESEARRLAKAKLALARAQFEAEANLRQRNNEIALDADQRMYDEGLLALEDYFENRRRVMLLNNQTEIDKLNKDRAETEATQARRRKDGAKQSELVGYDKDLAEINGRIAKLRADRTAINAEIDAETKKAVKDFAKKLTTSEVNLADTLGVRDLDQFFKLNIQQYADEWEIFLNQLATKGDKASSDLAKRLREAGKLEALDKTMQEADRPRTEALDFYDRQIEKLELLRETGAITTADMEKSAAQQRQATAEAVRRILVQNEATLAALGTNVDKNSTKYKQIVKNIDDARFALLELQSIANEVAVGINRDIGAGLQGAMTTLLSGRQEKERSEGDQFVLDDNASRIEDLRDEVFFLERASRGILQGYEGQQDQMRANLDAARSELNALEQQSARIRNDTKESLLDLIKRSASEFGMTMAESVRNAVTQNLAENAMSFLGGAKGEGGIGGFFADILGSSGELGASKAKPMWVKMADGAGGNVVNSDGETEGDGGAEFDIESPISSGIDVLKEKATGAFDFIGEKMSGVFGEMGGAFDGLGDSLMTMLDSVFGASGMLTKALTSFLASVMSSVFHSGGVVGMGGAHRTVNPAMFFGAARYHTGGIAGLRPDEVPAILQKGEEVLTAGDPRHRDNGGSMGTTNNVEVNVNMGGGSSAAANTDDAAKLGKAISTAVQVEIQKQQRPGGILYGKR